MAEKNLNLTCLRYQHFGSPIEKASTTWPERHVREARACPIFSKATLFGWLAFPPFDAEVTWHGGTSFDVRVGDVLLERLWSQVMAELIGWPSSWWSSKIEGVLQIDIGSVLITPPGVKLLVTGPLNRATEGFSVQSGILDSDWFWLPSTINLEPRLLGATFRLSRTTPIAQLLPLALGFEGPLEVSERQLEEYEPAHRMWLNHLSFVYGDLSDETVLPRRRKFGLYQEFQRQLNKHTK
ncbi:DUF6065 family protein [Rhizobium leguminosarum]|uniref:DUF6065 family protein n=1 Tax=Rhizobium leguminosarum TaxID=384 RepID=UPI001C937BCE|nr:DUF6065 family protein [Rhizobium leguminosarum]MBY5422318.1 hypothetical protein [Rhizobium leguminosarum]